MSTLRRRLLLYSAPVALLAVAAVVKLLSVVVFGASAQSSFTDRDTGALAGEVGVLQVADVVEPGKADFAAGALAVLEDRLTDADRHFSSALPHLDGDESCSAMVNLELIRETLGDRAAAAADDRTAQAHYLGARDVVDRAPEGCFAGNADPDPDRRTVRDQALTRLTGKIDAASAAPPPPPPPPAQAAPPPPAPGAAPTDRRSRLDPTAGDPLERLQQILRDAATR